MDHRGFRMLNPRRHSRQGALPRVNNRPCRLARNRLWGGASGPIAAGALGHARHRSTFKLVRENLTKSWRRNSNECLTKGLK